MRNTNQRGSAPWCAASLQKDHQRLVILDNTSTTPHNTAHTPDHRKKIHCNHVSPKRPQAASMLSSLSLSLRESIQPRFYQRNASRYNPPIPPSSSTTPENFCQSPCCYSRDTPCCSKPSKRNFVNLLLLKRYACRGRRLTHTRLMATQRSLCCKLASPKPARFAKHGFAVWSSRMFELCTRGWVWIFGVVWMLYLALADSTVYARVWTHSEMAMMGGGSGYFITFAVVVADIYSFVVGSSG